MFKLTPALYAHLKSLGYTGESEDAAQKFAFAKLADGTLTMDKVTELTKSATDKAAELADAIATKTATAVSTAVADALKSLLPPKPETPATPETPAVKSSDELLAEFKTKMKEYEDNFDAKLKAKLDELPSGITGGHVFDVLKLGAGIDKDDSPVNVHVKAVSSKFGTTKTQAFRTTKTAHPEHKIIRKHGSHGPILENPSEFEKAMGSVWCKYLICPNHLTENDHLILSHILHKEKFIVHGHAADSGIVTPSDIKAPRLLDAKERHDMLTKATVLIADNTGGGAYATPEFFDTNFILLPILGNELAPLTNIVDVPRGLAAQGFTMGNPSWNSGSTEGTAITAFTTDSFIGNHDFTFFRAAGAIKFGLNFLEDAVPGMVEAVMGRIMAKAAEWADEQVAIGDGTTEPEGIFSASGTTNVTIATPTTGPYVIGDLTEVLFAVAKAYRTAYPASRAAFVMTDTMYYLVRSIATGVTGDTRLIFGMNVEDYMLFNHPVAIVATGMTNDQFAFLQCGGYRLYRRQGVRFRQSSEGITNILANQMVLGYDMRFGGGLDRGGYAAVETSGVP
jgi:HK97 family phage major capsid protein